MKEEIKIKTSFDWNNVAWRDGFLWGLSIAFFVSLILIYFIVGV